MKIFDFDTIRNASIPSALCIDWVEEALKVKYESYLPSKISVKIDPDIFFNTMPAYIPSLDRFGVKVVSRFPQRTPALLGDILLYDASDGEMLALMDGSWITAMRTGAVAALAIQYLRSSKAREYAFMGLGNTARATLLCLLERVKEPLHIRLLAYKGQERLFMERFKDFPQLTFSVYPDAESLIEGADVVVSCVTVANELFAADRCFKPGVLVVPVHTRGFQNCDLFFDKVFADDRGHVCGFKYFDRFKRFDEFAHVLLKENPGRTSDEERILAYNIGIALHDVYFASKIYDKIQGQVAECSSSEPEEKFWV